MYVSAVDARAPCGGIEIIANFLVTLHDAGPPVFVITWVIGEAGTLGHDLSALEMSR